MRYGQACGLHSECLIPVQEWPYIGSKHGFLVRVTGGNLVTSPATY